MNRIQFTEGLIKISQKMQEQEKYLIELDARYGDGDLGISMKQGFAKTAEYAASSDEADLGIFLKNCAGEFNEAAPSSLGTILSFGFMGMAKFLKGKKEITLEELAQAMNAGIELIMKKAKSSPGEKTILDSLYPAIQALIKHAAEGNGAWGIAYEEAKKGMENTRNMKGVHGRIAYYGDKTIGQIDGGAVVGMLIFEALI